MTKFEDKMVKAILKGGSTSIYASTSQSKRISGDVLTPEDFKTLIKAVRKHRVRPIIRFKKEFPFMGRFYATSS